jgi:uncharacterized protein
MFPIADYLGTVLLMIFQSAGVVMLVSTMAIWWIFFATMLEALDFPFQIPVGDISWMIKGASSRLEDNSLA